MANSTTAIVWEIAPSAQLIPNVDRLDKAIQTGLGLLADLFAQKMQGEAQGNAPWNDVTSAARGGLRGEAEIAAMQVIIYLMHSVEYGPYLELGTYKMAPRPIILPTLQANYGPIMDALRKLLEV